MTHIIARFVNESFRIRSNRDREAYLTRLSTALQQTDWLLLSYALMSSHIHLAAIAGQQESWRWTKPLHTGFAIWLNRTQDTLGPVFAKRPTIITVAPDDTLRLLAYIHNNPVRAELVSQAGGSTWTSHRAYIGDEPAPPWLRVDEALSLCGLDASPEGRRTFDEYVHAHAAEPRDPRLAANCLERTRTRMRSIVRAPVEIGALHAPRDATPEVALGMFAPPGTPLRQRWDGCLQGLLARVAARTGMSMERIRSRERTQEVVRARRLVLFTAHRFLHRDITEAGAVVGISCQAASRLLKAASADGPLMQQAEEIARACWQEGEAVGQRLLRAEKER